MALWSLGEMYSHFFQFAQAFLLCIPISSLSLSLSQFLNTRTGKVLIVKPEERHRQAAEESQLATIVAISDFCKVTNESILKTVYKSLPYSEFSPV